MCTDDGPAQAERAGSSHGRDEAPRCGIEAQEALGTEDAD